MTFRKILVTAILAVGALVTAGCASQAPADIDDGTILVAGGSGRVGRYIVSHLADDGRDFRALTRSRDSAVERWGKTLPDTPWIEGDVRDAAQMRTAMAGITEVICVIGSRDRAGPNSAEFVDYGGVVNLVDAAVAAGVRHFVLLTAIGVTDPAHPFNKATRGALTWRLKGEAYLRDSGLTYTIVRPAGLQDRPAGEQALWIAQGDDWKPFLRATLSRDDLALVLIESLTNTGTRNATFEIANDPRRAADDWRASLTALAPDP